MSRSRRAASNQNFRKLSKEFYYNRYRQQLVIKEKKRSKEYYKIVEIRVREKLQHVPDVVLAHGNSLDPRQQTEPSTICNSSVSQQVGYDNT